jgi:hypothetical protein
MERQFSFYDSEVSKLSLSGKTYWSEKPDITLCLFKTAGPISCDFFASYPSHLFFLFAVIATYAINSSQSVLRGSANNATFGCTLDVRTMQKEKLVK